LADAERDALLGGHDLGTFQHDAGGVASGGHADFFPLGIVGVSAEGRKIAPEMATPSAAPRDEAIL